MTCYEKVNGPDYETTTIRKAGQTQQEKQRYCHQNVACQKKRLF